MNSTSTEANDLLKVEDIGLYYWLRSGMFKRRQFWALQDVSFHLKAGEKLGIIGCNGSGKSTLMGLLAGIMSPDAGRIVYNTNRISLLSLRLGFTRHLSGRHNAILGGMMLGMRRREIESRLDAIIEFAELGEFIDQPIRTYSSGMAARLGFSVALQIDPDVLLIDEVASVGDVAFREKSFALMEKKFAKDKAVVLVSHQPRFIKNFCNRAIWLNKGRIECQGETNSVLEAYRDSVPKALRGQD